jgi:hypothetical protein
MDIKFNNIIIIYLFDKQEKFLNLRKVLWLTRLCGSLNVFAEHYCKREDEAARGQF